MDRARAHAGYSSVSDYVRAVVEEDTSMRGVN